jgi:hypothetical protein
VRIMIWTSERGGRRQWISWGSYLGQQLGLIAGVGTRVRSKDRGVAGVEVCLVAVMRVDWVG